MIEVPSEYKPKINTVYPPNNAIEFERWFGTVYNENLDREYLGVYWCAYQVNHNYGNDKQAMQRLQEFIDQLPRNKKYFTISQYDDGAGVDFKDLDVLQFNMSKNIGVGIPLLCEPHPYRFNGNKKYIANFVGKRTHPIRDYANNLLNNKQYYISFADHNIHDYCQLISESLFTLCFRGYGANSFRVAEALQYESIPVVITDEFINPYNLNFEDFGVLIYEKDAHRIDEILKSIPESELKLKKARLKGIYDNYYTYNGAYNEIIRILKSCK